MAQLLIRSLDDDVKEKLRRRASSHGVSLEEEARQILREAANEPDRDQYGLGSEIASLFADFGITEDIPEIKGGGFHPAEFDE